VAGSLIVSGSVRSSGRDTTVRRRRPLAREVSARRLVLKAQRWLLSRLDKASCGGDIILFFDELHSIRASDGHKFIGYGDI
jgi:hypothetical protein